ncbi:Interferon-induced GTP-binding protein Mx1 [Camelus dromedarius]|uniref:Interferon-induced GTP-binding protein Mx1 n=1 Tax=Camelus dromedarius TaxID=9838 RepID=A0A5N4EJA6_CAMDR|nr:Interferon-induced GTP-binding protein Mx1 [Camelus dromedarius]
MVYSDSENKEFDSASASSHASLNGNDDMVEKNQETGPENNLYSQYEENSAVHRPRRLPAGPGWAGPGPPAIRRHRDQSSGKSSVLEALSGVALSRGSGIVTRCPLVLKLKIVNEDGWRGKVSFRDYEAQISDPLQVEKEVNQACSPKAASPMPSLGRSGNSHELISLEVSSPNVPDLTLIDLPGITRVAVGNQPHDIEYQ